MLTAEQAGLAEKYLGIAKAEAWNFHSRSNGRMSVDDCMSAAMFGLVQGLDAYSGYCDRNDFDPDHEAGRSGYLRKRCRGAVLDAARNADHLTRSSRRKVKAVRAVRAAEDAGARTDAELAAATGIAPAEIRRLQADALTVLNLDDTPEVEGVYAGATLADQTAEGDTEGQAGLSETLGAFMQAFGGLTAEQQVILSFRYFRELEFKAIAELLFTTEQRITDLHDSGVLAVHAALLKAVSALVFLPRWMLSDLR